jgi:hypothetical protein
MNIRVRYSSCAPRQHRWRVAAARKFDTTSSRIECKLLLVWWFGCMCVDRPDTAVPNTADAFIQTALFERPNSKRWPFAGAEHNIGAYPTLRQITLTHKHGSSGCPSFGTNNALNSRYHSRIAKQLVSTMHYSEHFQSWRRLHSNHANSDML